VWTMKRQMQALRAVPAGAADDARAGPSARTTITLAHGITTSFAAFNHRDGTVITETAPRQRAQGGL